MIKRFAWGVFLSLLLLPFALGRNIEPTANHQSGAQSDAAPSSPKFDNESYLFVLLSRGTKWTAEKTEETARLQEGHMANIRHMAALGKLVAAGPMGDDGDLRGIFIFRGASLEEAKELCAADPAIKSGRLKIDIYPWWGSKGIGVKYADEAKKTSPDKIPMVKIFLGLFYRGDNQAGATTTEPPKLLLDHLWHLRRQLDAGKMVAAGPFSGNSNLRGVMVLQTATLEEAKAIADQDPMVKAGRFKVELHPWWVAKGVMP